MPNAASHDTISRLWCMMQHLPSKPPGITTRELIDRLHNDGFTVTKRTVERDLQELSRHFGLTCNDKSTPFGWHWMKETSVDGVRCLEDADHRRYLRDAIDTLSPDYLFHWTREDIKVLLETAQSGDLKADVPFTEQQKAVLEHWVSSQLDGLSILIGLHVGSIDMVLRGEKHEDLSKYLGRYKDCEHAEIDPSYVPPPIVAYLPCPYCGAIMVEHLRAKDTHSTVCRRWNGGCGRSFYVCTGDSCEILSVHK